MFYLCSFYGRGRGGVESLLAALAVVLAVTLAAPPAPAQTGAEDKWVSARQEAMRAARAHLRVLEDMAAGAVPHDAKAARRARKALGEFAGRIPKLFRRARMDTVTRARTDIWNDPKGFVARARGLLLGVKALRVQNRAALAESLPGVIGACLACHTRFREPR